MTSQAAFSTQDDGALIQALTRGEGAAWAALVDRIGDLVYAFCADLYTGAEVEREYLRALEYLRADGFAALRGWQGRARLETHLALHLADRFASRVVELLAQDASRAWSAFERFYRHDIRRAIARRFPREREAHEDLYQEVCALLVEADFRRLRAFDRRGSFTGYVRRVVHNLCLDLYRRQRGRRRPTADGADRSSRPREVPLVTRAADGSPRERELADPAGSPEDVAADTRERQAREERLAAVLAAVATLPPEGQLYVRLRYLDDPPRPPREVARLMGRPEAEVYRLCERVVASLRSALAVKRPAGIPGDVRLGGEGGPR